MSTVGKTITCKAAVVWEFNKNVSIETIEVAPPNHDEVRVKVIASGLCHSDLSLMNGYNPLQPLPFVIGHEGAGIVESVGSKVTTVKPGDKVFTLFYPNCQKCKTCKGTRSNFCAELRPPNSVLRSTGTDGRTRFTCKGQEVYHYLGSSCMSEYTVIPETSCVKVSPKTPLETACILACGYSTGYGSSVNAVNIQSGDAVAVWGMGGVGLAAVVGCVDKGAKKIIGIDLTNEKEQVARKLGVTHFISMNTLKKPLLETILEINNGEGLDFTFACIGSTKAMEDAVQATSEGGTMVIVGVAPKGAVISVEPAFMLTGRKIVASTIGDYKVREHVPKLVDRYLAGKLPLDDFITHRFPLDELQKAFDVMIAGKSIRSVIKIASS